MANVQWSIPVTETTRFAIGSVTKQFTAASILLLQEQGLLRTTDKLSRYYPETPPAWKSVTLKELLQHTSGIPDGVRIWGTAGFDQGQHTPEQVVKSVAAQPLAFSPGSRTKYNNTAYLLLGLVIERVSRKSYVNFLQEHMFTPLHMLNTGLGSTAQVISHQASGYLPVTGEARRAMREADPLPFTTLFSAGGLYSTGADLAKWMVALHGGHVLRPESYAEMITADADGFGYGSEVSTQFGQTDIGKSGLVPGFTSGTEYFPATHTGIIVLSNQTDSRFSPGTHALDSDLMELACDGHAIVRSLSGEKTIDAALLKQYTGTYHSKDSAGVDTLQVQLEAGRLRLAPAGKQASTLLAKSATRFYVKEWDGQAEFHKDEGGSLTLDIFALTNETRTTWRKDSAAK